MQRVHSVPRSNGSRHFVSTSAPFRAISRSSPVHESCPLLSVTWVTNGILRKRRMGIVILFRQYAFSQHGAIPDYRHFNSESWRGKLLLITMTLGGAPAIRIQNRTARKNFVSIDRLFPITEVHEVREVQRPGECAPCRDNGSSCTADAAHPVI